MCVINVDQGLVPTTPAATVRPTVTVTAQESTTPSTVATSTGPTTTRLATSYIYISPPTIMAVVAAIQIKLFHHHQVSFVDVSVTLPSINIAATIFLELK